MPYGCIGGPLSVVGWPGQVQPQLRIRLTNFVPLGYFRLTRAQLVNDPTATESGPVAPPPPAALELTASRQPDQDRPSARYARPVDV
jgi:hypothetical protein